MISSTGDGFFIDVFVVIRSDLLKEHLLVPRGGTMFL